MSKTKSNLRIWLAAAAAMLSAAPAMAQSTDARAAIAAERSVQFYRPEDFSISPTGSDHDIVLMQEHEPWYVTAHAELDGSDNAFLTAPKHGDVWAAASLDAGFESTINESFDLQVGGQVSSARFSHYSELDTDALAGIISLSKQLDDAFRLGMDFVPSVYLGRGFEDQSLLSYELAMFGRYTKPLDERSMFVAYARLSRRWTFPDEFTNTRFAVTAAWQHECSPSMQLTAGVTLAYSVYDDYFQSFTGERRKDFLVNPFVSLVYQLNAWSDVGVSISLARNYSSIDKVDYEAAAISPYIELNWRF
ncbi:hypothetical protein BH10PLA1_BH10PLA1_02760 [soil metagenome]